MTGRIIITLPEGRVEEQSRDIAGRGYDTNRTMRLDEAERQFLDAMLAGVRLRCDREAVAKRMDELRAELERLEQAARR
jgi:hypothetical protein